MNVFEQYYLTERKSKSECFDKFGKELFGELRGKGEKDTQLEKEVLQKFIRFVEYGDDRDIERNLAKLMNCKTHYPDELIPDDRVLYRGLVIDGEDLDSYIPDNAKVNDRIDGIGFYKFKYRYTPTKPVDSWTSDISVAASFAIGMQWGIAGHSLKDFFDEASHRRENVLRSESKFPLILEIPTRGNQKDLLMDTDLTNLISKRGEANAAEYEVLRISRRSIMTQARIDERSLKQLLMIRAMYG